MKRNNIVDDGIDSDIKDACEFLMEHFIKECERLCEYERELSDIEMLQEPLPFTDKLYTAIPILDAWTKSYHRIKPILQLINYFEENCCPSYFNSKSLAKLHDTRSQLISILKQSNELRFRWKHLLYYDK